MKNDSIVGETRKLRERYAALHGYDIHRIAQDLRAWEEQGFPPISRTDETLETTPLKPAKSRTGKARRQA